MAQSHSISSHGLFFIVSVAQKTSAAKALYQLLLPPLRAVLNQADRSSQ